MRGLFVFLKVECSTKNKNHKIRIAILPFFYFQQHIESPLATDTDILALHSPEHLSNMKDIYGMDLESLKRQHVYVNEHTDNAIRRAVGGTQALTKAVLEGKLQNGIALVRPPGHHAGENYWRKHTILVPMHG